MIQLLLMRLLVKKLTVKNGNDIININCNNNSNIIAGDGNDRLNINGSN